MTIWMYVDEFSSMMSSTAKEYAEIRGCFRKWLPKHKILFCKDKRPHELANARPDIYVFDIGGLCYVDYSGNQRHNFCHEVVRQVEDHPNTLFVPWTSMTRASLRFAMTEFLPEFAGKAEDDREFSEGLRPNVWCPGENEDRNLLAISESSLKAIVKKWGAD